MRRLKRLWQNSTIIAKVGIPLLIVLAVVIAGDYMGLRFFGWAGVSNYTKPSDLYEPGKSLWDWLDLLIIPAVLAGGALWLNQSERRTEREIADKRSQEAMLQAYLDRMTELLLEKELRKSNVHDEVRAVARARTLTALRQLDGQRKATLLRFLYEADLISGDKVVVALQAADLSGADLSWADLSGANLSRARLREADLSMADLREADLSRANLSWADLHGADLKSADLNAAYLRGADLGLADLRGANLSGTNLREAVLREAVLREADLSWADLHGADLNRANLSGIIYDDRTKWPDNFTPPPNTPKEK